MFYKHIIELIKQSLKCVGKTTIVFGVFYVVGEIFKTIIYILIYNSTDSRIIFQRLHRLCKNSVQL